LGLLDESGKPICDKNDLSFANDLPSLETLQSCPGAMSNLTLPTEEFIRRREEINNIIRKQRLKLQQHYLQQQLFYREETRHGRAFNRAVRRSETFSQTAIPIRVDPIPVEPIREAPIRMEVDSSTSNSIFL
jgi:hypothetical protein